MVNPITPEEMESKLIPDIVLEIVNQSIKSNWDGSQSIIDQEELVAKIVSKMEISPTDVFANHWLDFEETYQSVGWIVKYEKPLKDEFFEPHFIFKKPK